MITIHSGYNCIFCAGMNMGTNKVISGQFSFSLIGHIIMSKEKKRAVIEHLNNSIIISNLKQSHEASLETSEKNS